MRVVLRSVALILLLSSVSISRGQTSPEATDIGQTPPEKIFKIGGAVSPPHATYTPDPEYSDEARKAHFEGKCVLVVVIGTDGRTRGIRVERSLGKGLDEKAIDAVSRWQFKPAMKAGQPVPVRVNVEINFRLYDSLSASLTSLRNKANRGDAKAQLKLAETFLDGRGVPKDEPEGLVWLQISANQGLPEAQFRLGEYTFDHAKNSADYVTAYTWYSLAERRHYKNADKRLRALAPKMSPEQISEAESKADHWTVAAK